MTLIISTRAAFVFLLTLGSIVALQAEPAAAAKDPCKVSCSAERKDCKSAFKTAFQVDKSECTGTGRARRHCIRAARQVFRAARKDCSSFASECRTCCDGDGTSCDVRCGDGIVSAGEDCDPSGSNTCPGGATCSDGCHCPVPTTTSTIVPTTTSILATTTSVPASTSSTTATLPGSSTTTTSEVPSTTVTTTSSTTSTTNYCFGKADGSPCPTDTNICSADVCRDGVCTHDTLVANLSCGSANGSPCDADDRCGLSNSGPLCQDRKRASYEYCLPQTPAQYACHQYLLCSGFRDECPPEPLCLTGQACNGDDECVTGVCVAGVCAGKANVGEACDTSVDCAPNYACDGGLCLGVLDTWCTAPDQCVAGLFCDNPGSGRCRVPIGDHCTADAQCVGWTYSVTAIACDPVTQTCRRDLDGPCARDADCLSGYCYCGRLDVAVDGYECAPPGVCKFPPGYACTEHAQCAGSYVGGINVQVGFCDDGTCATTIAHGAICKTGPDPGVRRCCTPTSQTCLRTSDCPSGGSGQTCAGAIPLQNVLGHCCEATDQSPTCATAGDCAAGQACTLRPPQLGDPSNGDGQCRGPALGGGGPGEFCFKGAGGDDGPCTPPDQPCGGPVNPEDYVCCRDLGGTCSNDADCCGLFAAAARGCGSASSCTVLKKENEPCVTSADCLRSSDRHGPLQCTNGLCAPPPVMLPKGSPCELPTQGNPNPPQCGAGLQCFDCRGTGLGYRCADANSPCCRSGGNDRLECGQTYLGGIPYDALCCDYKCSERVDDTHCGSCENDCTADPGNACVLDQPGQCVFEVGAAPRCEYQIDESICANVTPPAGQLEHCVSIGLTPAAFCQPYTPVSNTADWQGLIGCSSNPQGAECVSDAQCCFAQCRCTQSDSMVETQFSITGAVKSCHCEP